MLYITITMLLFCKCINGAWVSDTQEIIVPEKSSGSEYSNSNGPKDSTRQYLEEVTPATSQLLDSKETAVPSKYLGPRNYNNHPSDAKRQYLEEVQPTKKGPVLFPNDVPPPPRPPLVVTLRPLAESIARSDRTDLLNEFTKPKNRFPVTKPGFRLRKASYKPAFSAIKDFWTPKLPKKLGKKRVEEEKNGLSTDGSDENSNYAFAYKVKDHATGDDYSHYQRNKGLTTNGEYRVRLPDGRMQIVSYKADNKGYKAKVRYDDTVNKYFEVSDKYDKLSDDDDKPKSSNSEIFRPDFKVLDKYKNIVHNLIAQPPTPSKNNKIRLANDNEEKTKTILPKTTLSNEDYCKEPHLNSFLCAKLNSINARPTKSDYSDFVNAPESVNEEVEDESSKLDYSDIVNSSPKPYDPYDADYHDVTLQLYPAVNVNKKCDKYNQYCHLKTNGFTTSFPPNTLNNNLMYNYEDDESNYQENIVYVTPRPQVKVNTDSSINHEYGDVIHEGPSPSEHDYIDVPPQLDPVLHDYPGVIPIPKSVIKHDALDYKRDFITKTNTKSVTQTVYNNYDHLLNSYTLKPGDLLKHITSSVSTTTPQPKVSETTYGYGHKSDFDVHNDVVSRPFKDYNDMDVQLSKDIYNIDYSLETESELHYPPHRSKFLDAFFKYDNKNDNITVSTTASTTQKQTSLNNKVFFYDSINPKVELKVHSTPSNPSNEVGTTDKVITIKPKPVNYNFSNNLSPSSNFNNYVSDTPVGYLNNPRFGSHQTGSKYVSPKTNFYEIENSVSVTPNSYDILSVSTPKTMVITPNNIILLSTPSTYIEPRTSERPFNGLTPKSYLESTIASLNERINHKPTLSENFKNKVYNFLRY